MTKRWALAILLAAACGDNSDLPGSMEQPPDAATPVAATCDDSKVVDTLRAIPKVAAVTESPCGPYVQPGGVRCFKIEFTQPIQHTAPAGKTFGQQLWLQHRGCARPMLVGDWGYSQDYFFDDELSTLYKTNALWIEHRFQGVSLPAAEADWDWTALTIENGAADMHEIVAAFRTHYGENFVSTGASKGGVTSTYHYYLYQDDLDGAIPYVAPASRSTRDPGYQKFLETYFPPCATAIRDAQVAALTTRKAAMLSRLLDDGVPPGAEGYYLDAIVDSFDWAFWQYYGNSYCASVPAATATDDAFYTFFYNFTFGGIAPPALGTPDQDKSRGALYYEWLTQQGFALQTGAHVQPYITDPFVKMTMEDNFREDFPTVTLPKYDGSLTMAARRWARDHAPNLLLIYGQYDPWTGGAIDAPKQPSSARFFVPKATHGAQLTSLPANERTAALAVASRLFGVEPNMPMMAQAERAGARVAQMTGDNLRKITAQIAHRRMRR